MIINLCGSKWEVLQIEGNNSLLLCGEKRCKGTTHYYDHKIYVDKDLIPEEKRRTLIHELSHAVLYSTQLSVDESFSEEQLCEFMGLYADKIADVSNVVLALEKW